MSNVTNYQVVFHFRNGKILNILTNNVTTKKGPKASSNYIYLENKPIASVGKSPGQVFQENEVIFHNASPLPELFKHMPDEWDIDDPALRIIDTIKIFTQKIVKN